MIETPDTSPDTHADIPLEVVPESTPPPRELTADPVETPTVIEAPPEVPPLVYSYRAHLSDLRAWLASEASVTPGIIPGAVLVGREALEQLANLAEAVNEKPIAYGFEECQARVMEFLDALDVRMRDINSLSLHDLRALMASVRALEPNT